MKLSVLTLFIILCSFVGFSQITKIEYETEEGHQHLEGENHSHDIQNDKMGKKTNVDLLKGFDLKKANADFDALGYPENERAGYIKAMQNQYLIVNHADFMVHKTKDKLPFIPQKSGNCPNAGFENLAFGPQWTGGIGMWTTGSNPPIIGSAIVSNGLNAAVGDPLARHTIMTTPPVNNNPFFGSIAGYDPNAINPSTGIAEIPFLAPNGGISSVRLGNSNIGGQKDRLRYTVNVNANNRAFFYQFAVVFQNPAGHNNTEPYFRIRVLDSSGVAVAGPCGQYNVVSTVGSTDTSYTPWGSSAAGGFYRKWDRVDIDLSAYLGQVVTIEFETGDCALSGHFGYAYIDAGCLENLDTKISYCVGDPAAILVAQPGFASYQWFGPNNFALSIPNATNDTLSISNPNLNDTYQVIMTTTNGCQIAQVVTVEYSVIEINNIISNPTCFGSPSGSAIVQASGSGSGYNFVFTGPTPATNPTGNLINALPGNYTVIVNNPSNAQCGADTAQFSIDLTAFVQPARIDVKFCEGVGTIQGPPSTSYQWFNNALQPIAAPIGTSSLINDTDAFAGEKYYLKYQLPNGCFDSIVYTFVDSRVNSIFTFTQPNGCRSLRTNFRDRSPNSDVLTYSINGPNGFNNVISNTTDTTWLQTNLDTGTYFIRVIDEGCFYDTSFLITDLSSYNEDTLFFCPADQQFLSTQTTGPGFVHSWTDPNGVVIGTNQTIVISNIIPGYYIDSILVGPGCYAIAAFLMQSISSQTDIQTKPTTCYGGEDGEIVVTITATVPGAQSFSTQGPNGFSSTDNPLLNLSPGLYLVTSKIGSCTQTDTVIVGQPPLPSDTLSIFTQVCGDLDQGTIYAPEGFTEYQWFENGVPIQGANGDSLIIPLPNNLTSFSVTWKSPFDGCTKLTNKLSTAAVAFGFTPSELNNVFTPNGDPINAIYHPFQEKNLTNAEIFDLAGEYNMTIFNRWGQRLFETNNYNQGWDGKDKSGRDVSDGTYFAEIIFRTKCDTDEPLRMVTPVQVIR